MNPTTTLRERTASWLRRWFRRALGLTIGAVAAIWSFDTLTNLALHLGFGELSWMFPLTIDAVAALGMDYWMTRSPAWRFGRVMAFVAIGVSIVGNVADWILRDSAWYAALFGVIPPAALAAVLGIMHRNAAGEAELLAWLAAEREWLAGRQEAQQAEEDRRARGREARQARKRVETHPRETGPRNVTELSPKPDLRQLPSSDEERLQLLVAQARETGTMPTKREVQAALRVGSGKALELTRTVRETIETARIETEEPA